MSFVLIALLAGISQVSVFAASSQDAWKEEFLPVLNEEYEAVATYVAIIAAYGEIRPYTNLYRAEQKHLAALLRIAERHGLDVTEPNPVISLPSDLESVRLAGLALEEADIALLTEFLESDLPDDVRVVITNLLDASKNHAAALSGERSPGGRNGGRGNGSGRQTGGGRGKAAGR